MRKAVDAGWIEMFRRTQKPEEFKTGSLFPGRGESGSGTYVYARRPGSTTSPDTLRKAAEHYATPGSDDPGDVIHMAMHPHALTTDLRSLTAKRDKELESIRAELDMEPQKSAKRTALEERMDVISDVGRYGAIQGWDAYWVNDSNIAVVLNRTALIVKL
ncbi:hypothetical protein AB0B25_30080 [Nocardia sp. NPDC049190]|uniref:hypothetical protein n=1 Tax=Nocardia sp. NPDC049190 TaxID=3155650 RepID=UPI0034111F14